MAFIGIVTASAMLHLSPKTFKRGLDDGTFLVPYTRLGRKYLFKEKDIQELMEKSFKIHVVNKKKDSKNDKKTKD